MSFRAPKYRSSAEIIAAQMQDPNVRVPSDWQEQLAAFEARRAASEQRLLWWVSRLGPWVALAAVSQAVTAWLAWLVP